MEKLRTQTQHQFAIHPSSISGADPQKIVNRFLEPVYDFGVAPIHHFAVDPDGGAVTVGERWGKGGHGLSPREGRMCRAKGNFRAWDVSCDNTATLPITDMQGLPRISFLTEISDIGKIHVHATI